MIALWDQRAHLVAEFLDAEVYAINDGGVVLYLLVKYRDGEKVVVSVAAVAPLQASPLTAAPEQDMIPSK